MRMCSSIAAALALLITARCVHAAVRIDQAELSESGISIRFDRPMLSWNMPVELRDIVIDPPLPCRWWWSDDLVLSCNFSADAPPLRPASSYRLDVKGGIWSRSGEALAAQTLQLESERPEISLDVADWVDAEPTIFVEANQRVGARSVESVLRVTAGDDTSLRYRLVESASSRNLGRNETERVRWRLAFDTPPQRRLLTVAVRPGLMGVSGPLPGVQDKILARIYHGEPFRFRTAVCRTGFFDQRAEPPSDPGRLSCPAGSTVQIDFSRRPDAGALATWSQRLPKGLALRNPPTPTPAYTTRDREVKLGPGWSIGITIERARDDFTIEIPAEFSAEDGDTLGQRTTLKLSSTDFPTLLAVPQPHILVKPGESAPAVGVARNVSSIRVAEHMLGAGTVSTATSRFASRGRNRLQPLRLPEPPSRDIMRNGGLVLASYRDLSRPDLSIAYAPFDIAAFRSARQILVWVNGWSDRAPRAGARVELLRFEKPELTVRVIATGTTGADGVATFDSLPDDIAADGTWLVRASDADQRSILPLDSVIAGTSAGYYNDSDVGNVMVWGVTDKPLYRPGDLVRYRLWFRERDNNRLRVAWVGLKVPLILGGEWRYDETASQKWIADADADGSTHGEIRLPAQAPDGTFCIKSDRSRQYPSGACFTVANYHASALWAEVEPQQVLAYDGDTVSFKIGAGFYSGGPAIGAVAEPQVLLTPLRLEQAFPEFADFRFIDPYDGTEGEGGEGFPDQVPRAVTLDETGGKRVSFVLHDSRSDRAEYTGRAIPFGTLEISAHVRTSPSVTTTSSPAQFRVSRFREFVGLKMGYDLRADSDPELSAIVIDAEGKRVEATDPIDVTVTEAPSETASNRDEPAHKPEPIARCQLVQGLSQRCSFRAPKSGLYRFTASRGVAAAVSLDRYVWTHNGVRDAEAPQVTLERIGNVETSNEFLLSQPFARANVLFTIAHGGVLKHWTVDLNGRNHAFKVDLQPEWAPGVSLGALVLDASGQRTAPSTDRGGVESATLDVAIPRAFVASSLDIQVPDAQVAPGSEIEIRLRNRSTATIDVTLAVVDEALRVLAPEVSARQDPQSEQWLGSLDEWTHPNVYSLAGWQRALPEFRFSEYYSVADLDAAIAAGDRLETIVVTGSRVRAADVFMRGGEHDKSLRLPQPGTGGARSSRARAQFLDSAYWNPSLTIDGGKTHVVRFALPDNLTRWKLIALSHTGDDDFRLDEASVTAGLVIEARPDLPVRLFVDDHSEIGIAARNSANAARTVSAGFSASGAGVNVRRVAEARVAAGEQMHVSARIRPHAVGPIDVSADARSGKDNDAVIGQIPVVSSVARERVALAGWLTSDDMTMKLPPLPAGADDVRLRISVRRDLDGLIEQWILSLRDYPHNCWEQQVSRAVGAAAALRLGKGELWPGAQPLIDETIHAAPAFRENGMFRFFVDGNFTSSSVLLTAYTVQALEALRAWGQAGAAPLIADSRAALEREIGEITERLDSWNGGSNVTHPSDITSALAVLAGVEKNDRLVREMLGRWSSLDTYERSRLALAMLARPGQFDTAPVRADLIDSAPLRADRRTLDNRGDRSVALGSDLRDQCALIDALRRLDAPAQSVEEWRRGLVDLYAGGYPSSDSQAAAQCVMSLLAIDVGNSSRGAAIIRLQTAGAEQTLALGANEAQVDGSANLTASTRDFRLFAATASDTLSFVAEYDYRLDQQFGTASGTGLSISRDYAVIRDGAWQTANDGNVEAGEWVRVRLRVTVSAARYHVAVVDSVPAGLQPEDLELDRVAGVTMRDSDIGTPWFGTRQLRDTQARFYAEALPPGDHDVYYYARASHRGDFLALPASAEQMYGRAGVARTAAARLRVH